MPRYFYIGVLIVIATIGAVLFVYRTELPAQIPLTAEFGGVSLRIEYATTTVAREKGLGGRKSIPDNYGMLFVFEKDDRYGFWMKDMLMPVDIFWFDNKGQVVSIARNVATSTYPNVFYPTEPAQYVLETVASFADKYNISTGTPLLLKNFPIVSK
ncbi:MAG: DUF192 domain-containing protein [bacterium]